MIQFILNYIAFQIELFQTIHETKYSLIKDLQDKHLLIGGIKPFDSPVNKPLDNWIFIWANGQDVILRHDDTNRRCNVDGLVLLIDVIEQGRAYQDQSYIIFTFIAGTLINVKRVSKEINRYRKFFR